MNTKPSLLKQFYRESFRYVTVSMVDYCYDEGLYVVINIHHDDEDKNFVYPTEEYKEQSIGYITQIWTQVNRQLRPVRTRRGRQCGFPASCGTTAPLAM